MKKFRRSRITTACYVIAALIAVYFIAVSASTLKTIFDYYAPYGVSPGVGETIGYLLQNGLTPFFSAVALFMAGRIHDDVRRLNPENFATDEEIEDAKEAKRAARDAKKAAKAEKKAVRTEDEIAAAAAEPVEADFSAVTEPETEEEPAEAEEE